MPRQVLHYLAQQALRYPGVVKQIAGHEQHVGLAGLAEEGPPADQPGFGVQVIGQVHVGGVQDPELARCAHDSCSRLPGSPVLRPSALYYHGAWSARKCGPGAGRAVAALPRQPFRMAGLGAAKVNRRAGWPGAAAPGHPSGPGGSRGVGTGRRLAAARIMISS
jgi:hypothetical protein